MREIAKLDYRRIKARLYLNAVLPAFEDLLLHSEEARKILNGQNFTIQFQTSSGLRSVLQFKEQACTFDKSGKKSANIILHFITEDHLNKEFEGSGFRIPIPIKGASRMTQIKIFKALSAEMETALRPNEKQLEDSDFYELNVSMQLGVALRAVVELVLHEPRSKRIMKATPEGIAYFSVGAEGYGAWLRWEKGRLSYGKGHPEYEPDVNVTFADAATALKAVDNRIDVMAAVGLGEIKISGLVPLADSLGYIFERIPLYIHP